MRFSPARVAYPWLSRYCATSAAVTSNERLTVATMSAAETPMASSVSTAALRVRLNPMRVHEPGQALHTSGGPAGHGGEHPGQADRIG
jgi:hypothetical protein